MTGGQPYSSGTAPKGRTPDCMWATGAELPPAAAVLAAALPPCTPCPADGSTGRPLPVSASAALCAAAAGAREAPPADSAPCADVALEGRGKAGADALVPLAWASPSAGVGVVGGGTSAGDSTAAAAALAARAASRAVLAAAS